MKKLIIFLLASLLWWGGAWGQTIVVKRWPDSLSTNGRSTTIWDLLVAKNGNVFAATVYNNVPKSPAFRTSDDGQNWTNLWSNGNSGLASDMGFGVSQNPESETILLGTWNGIFLSSNNGENWQQPPPPPPYYRWGSVSKFSYFEGKIFAGAAGSVLVSEDGGGSWRYLPFDSTRILPRQVMDVAVSFNGTIFAVTHQDNDNNYYGLYRSLDSGRTWHQANNGLPAQTLLSVATTGEGVVYVGTGGNGLYKSVNNGDNWEKINDFPGLNVYDILIIKPNLIFAAVASATTGGVYRYDGQEWKNISPANNDIKGAISLARKGNNLFIGTSNGVYLAYDVITSLSVEKEPTVPSAFQLSQNYPNPFNPSTTIEFSLPQRSFVKLSIYNLLGKEITVLVEGQKEVGIHQVQWDASALASGVYLYRLETSTGFVAARKMLLVK